MCTHFIVSATVNPLQCPNGTYTYNDTIELQAAMDCFSCIAGKYCRYVGLTLKMAQHQFTFPKQDKIVAVNIVSVVGFVTNWGVGGSLWPVHVGVWGLTSWYWSMGCG